MATIDIDDDSVRIRLTLLEKVFALRGDVTVPRDAVTAVERFENGLDAVAGLRAPGLALHGRIKIGTWRRREGKELVVVRRDQPAVRMELHGQRWRALVIGTADPAAVMAQLT